MRVWPGVLLSVALLGCGARTDLAAPDAGRALDAGAPAVATTQRAFVMRANNMLVTLRWVGRGSGSTEVALLRARFEVIDTDGMGFVMDRDAALTPVSTPISIDEEIPFPRSRWTRLPLRDACNALGCEMQFYFGHNGGNTLHPATIDLRVELTAESPAISFEGPEIVVHSYDD